MYSMGAVTERRTRQKISEVYVLHHAEAIEIPSYLRSICNKMIDNVYKKLSSCNAITSTQYFFNMITFPLTCSFNMRCVRRTFVNMKPIGPTDVICRRRPDHRARHQLDRYLTYFRFPIAFWVHCYNYADYNRNISSIIKWRFFVPSILFCSTATTSMTPNQFLTQLNRAFLITTLCNQFYVS